VGSGKKNVSFFYRVLDFLVQMVSVLTAGHGFFSSERRGLRPVTTGQKAMKKPQDGKDIDRVSSNPYFWARHTTTGDPMEKSNALNILKNAFLMERQGKSLYETARDKAEDDAVKAFFDTLAAEEQQHMTILEAQFKAIMKTGRFAAGGYETDGAAETPPEILTQDLKEKIHAAGFEATAITAAVGFEQKAVQLYGDRAEITRDPEEKKLYQWLAAWEQTHLNKLLALQEALKQQIWEDNSFWPF
jgi:rubrerythrin